jgi:sialidase-1
MIRLLEHKKLYGRSRFHAAFPSIAKFNDENLLLAFRRARDGLWLIPEEKRKTLDVLNRMDHIDSRSHIMLMELDKQGQQTNAELDMLPIDPEAADQDPSILVLPDQKVLLNSFGWYPLPSDAAQHVNGRIPPGEDYPGCRFVFWGAHSSLRNREKGVWKASHRYIPPDGGFGYSLSPGGEKQISGSVRGQAIYQDEKIYQALYGGKNGESALFVSTDEGYSWEYHAGIARDTDGKITFQEPALCPDENGGFVCFMRTAGTGGYLATCHSEGGEAWSPFKLHDLWGHPFHPLVLEDGRVLLTYGYRREPFGVRARLLDSPLQNPDDCEEFIIRDDGLNTDVGYPWSVQLDNGRFLTVYYMTDASGMRYIAGSWFELE